MFQTSGVSWLIHELVLLILLILSLNWLRSLLLLDRVTSSYAKIWFVLVLKLLLSHLDVGWIHSIMTVVVGVLDFIHRHAYLVIHHLEAVWDTARSIAWWSLVLGTVQSFLLLPLAVLLDFISNSKQYSLDCFRYHLNGIFYIFRS